MPYSWAAETPVSNFETRMDDSYRERQDPAITVRLELRARAGRRRGRTDILDLDDHALDPALEPGRSRWVRTSTTRCSMQKDGAVDPRGRRWSPSMPELAELGAAERGSRSGAELVGR